MRRIWSIIDELNFTQKTKNKMFIMFNTAGWTCVALLLCIIFGAFFGTFSDNWIKITMIIIGYIGIGIGFFGSVMYLLRNS